MRKFTLLVAILALLISIVVLLRPILRSDDEATNTWKSERQYPPLVFTSMAKLDCSISSTANGRQVLTTVSGQGFTFDTAMLPILDGQVTVKDPGMKYKFTAFPASAVAARFSGLGEGTITEMMAEVEVDVKRFNQPGGPGTNISFQAEDINADSAYVEFTGVFVRYDQKRFPFRVVFGRVTHGSGDVTPGSAEKESKLVAKKVMLGSEQQPATVTTVLYEAEDGVRDLRQPVPLR